MDCITKEAIRYLGYKNEKIDEQTKALLKEAFQEIAPSITNRFTYTIAPIEVRDNEVELAHILVESQNLAFALRGCKYCVLLAATLGSEVDRLIRRYSIGQISKASVLQALATAWLEEYVGKEVENLWNEEKLNYPDCFLLSRFSPGYGDFSLEAQGEILQMLQASNKTGIRLTSGGMMTPLKSITAVIGISSDKMRLKEKTREKCTGCKQADCQFRKG